MSEQAVTPDRRLPALVGIGFVGGLLAGLLGVGGGVVLVPLMVTLFGVRQHLAHGTSLAVVAVTAAIAAARYAQQGFLPRDGWLLALELVVGTVVGVNFGARLMNRLPAHRLRQVFGAFMVVVGLRMALALGEGAAPLFDWQGDAVLVIAVLILIMGLVIGVLSGLLGVGGGVFMVPMMVLLLGVPQHIAQGISLAVVFPTGVVGTHAHFRRGNVDTTLAIWIGVGSVLAALVGTQIVGSISDAALRQLFGVLLVGTGLRMLWPGRR